MYFTLHSSTGSVRVLEASQQTKMRRLSRELGPREENDDTVQKRIIQHRINRVVDKLHRM